MHLFGDYFDYYSHNMTSMYLGTMVLFCGKGRLSVYLPPTKLRQLLVREYFVASICSLKNISAKSSVGDSSGMTRHRSYSGNRELCCFLLFLHCRLRYSSNGQRSPHPLLPLMLASLPPLGSTHHKISHRQKFRAGPVLTACTSVRLVYTGACEGLGRMGTLRKMWRV